MLENKNQERTALEEMGEFGLIHHLTKDFPLYHKTTIQGVGDDAAVLDFKGAKTVVTNDLLIEGVHFDLAYTPLKHLGYKAVIANLSDIYAMNAAATQILVSLAVSNRFPLEALEELYAGIALACSLYKVDLVGGDTTSSNKGMMISVTAIGVKTQAEIAYRKNAGPNDLLVVSGDLGGAYMGLQVLEREKEVYKVNPGNQPDLEPYSYIVERQLKPEARKDIVELLKALEVDPTAMIDISDGLSSEILHLCKESQVGCSLFEDKIPLDPTVISACEEFRLDSTLVALSGGEDYELLFTIDQKDFDKIKGNPNLTIIGHMTHVSQGANLITRGGSQIPLTAQGWSAFNIPLE
ncbi:MAG: thiamine-phosphate kinase [Bacteroidota bacterium]